MPVDPDKVYETARSLLPAAISFSRRRGFDPAQAEDFLMEAAEKLIDPQRRQPTYINNLPGYLFTSFKYLVRNELRKRNRYENLTEKQFEALSDEQVALREIEKEILKEEILRHLNTEARFIFDCRVLGYSFKETARLFNEQFNSRVAENAIRIKYSRALQRAAKELRS